ncbi:neprilysin-1-like [Amblyomma americanum]
MAWFSSITSSSSSCGAVFTNALDTSYDDHKTLHSSLPFSVDHSNSFNADAGNYTVCKTEVCKERAKLINASLDLCVDPCEDFYSYACGGWKKNHPIPESKSYTGIFPLLRDELQGTLRSILENMTLNYECQNVTDKAAVAYNACMAVPALEDRRDVMMEIMNASGVAQWPITNDTGGMFKNCTEVLNSTGIFTIFSVQVTRDAKELNSSVIMLDQLEFKIVGRNQLIHPEKEGNKGIIAAYKKLIKTALSFVRPNLTEEELTELSDALVSFEGQLANMTAPPEERHDVLKLYHRMAIQDLEKNFTNVRLLDLLKKQFSTANITLSDNETVELYALDYYSGLNNFLASADPKTLYNYAGLKVMLGFGAQVSDQFRNASFELSKVITGVVAEKPRWETCVRIVNEAMPEIVGLLYVQHKFSKEAKAEVEDLVQRLVVVFNETLQKANWMDNKTRIAAEEKLYKMGTKIGYPEWLYNVTYLERIYQYVPDLCPNCSFAQMMHWIYQNRWVQQMLKLRKPYDKDADWTVGTAVVNAFYNPSTNEMLYPAGILQGVFYQHGLPRSLNFGAIGMVVGHEMTHGFDDLGSQFDADGALQEWWTNSTRTHFEKKAKCFEYQYGNITDPEANMTLNGKNTLGENIADNGGLRMAFKAYSRLLKDEYGNNDTRLPGLEHLSGKKLFFLSNAMVWCSNIRPGDLRQQIQYDPHAPDQYRVNVPMSNMPAFSTVFNCSANSTMNRTRRCTLW